MISNSYLQMSRFCAAEYFFDPYTKEEMPQSLTSKGVHVIVIHHYRPAGIAPDGWTKMTMIQRKIVREPGWIRLGQ